MLEIPLDERLIYDPDSNTFFVNFEGMSVRGQSAIEQIRTLVAARLGGLDHKVRAIVNYENFSILPELLDSYSRNGRRSHKTVLSQHDAVHDQRVLACQARGRAETAPRRPAHLRHRQRGACASAGRRRRPSFESEGFHCGRRPTIHGFSRLPHPLHGGGRDFVDNPRLLRVAPRVYVLVEVFFCQAVDVGSAPSVVSLVTVPRIWI